jgi:hypothetical protein
MGGREEVVVGYQLTGFPPGWTLENGTSLRVGDVAVI